MAGFQQSIMDQVNIGRVELQKRVDHHQVPLPLELQVDCFIQSGHWHLQNATVSLL